jgi:hypothetical protein
LIHLSNLTCDGRIMWCIFSIDPWTSIKLLSIKIWYVEDSYVTICAVIVIYLQICMLIKTMHSINCKHIETFCNVSGLRNASWYAPNVKEILHSCCCFFFFDLLTFQNGESQNLSQVVSRSCSNNPFPIYDW